MLMGEQTDGSIKKETGLNPQFQEIRDGLEKLEGLRRYMNFPFRSQDLHQQVPFLIISAIKRNLEKT